MRGPEDTAWMQENRPEGQREEAGSGAEAEEERISLIVDDEVLDRGSTEISLVWLVTVLFHELATQALTPPRVYHRLSAPSGSSRSCDRMVVGSARYWPVAGPEGCVRGQRGEVKVEVEVLQ
jgi:hypothetical protein